MSLFGSINSLTPILTASQAAANLTRISTSSPINGMVSAASLIDTTENNARRFYPLLVICQAANVSGLVSVATVNIGTNAATYNDIATIVLTGVNATNKYLPVSMAAALSSVAPNTGIYVNVTGIAVATTYTLNVHILGFYL